MFKKFRTSFFNFQNRLKLLRRRNVVMERNTRAQSRLWWVIAVSLSIWFCGSSIRDTWMKWSESPVTMNFADKVDPISTIPFPTVTICPETKTLKDKLDIVSVIRSLNKGEHISDIERIRMNAVSNTCKTTLYNFGDKYANETIFDEIIDVAPTFEDVVKLCLWPRARDYQTTMMAPILTIDGLCFTFNALNSRDVYTEEMAPGMMIVNDRPNASHWSLETGYDDEAVQNRYPIRTTKAQYGRLKIGLQVSADDIEYLCRGPIPGFKIYFHMPGEVVGTNGPSVRVSLSEEVTISIKPNLVITSDGLRSYSSDQRQCYFNSERKLRFFRHYSQQNCETECLANKTLKVCGCVNFFMPRENGTKICGSSMIPCTIRWTQSTGDNEEMESSLENCNCLPACTSVSYEALVDRAKSDLNAVYEKSNSFKIFESSVSISFRDDHVMTLIRREKYTYTDFLAFCGGLLGLGLGISALSFIEILYYATIRLYWTLRQQKSENAVVPFERPAIKSISIDIPNK